MLKEGYYILREDVTNPKPDRRSRSKNHAPVWQETVRVQLKLAYREGENMFWRIYFIDNSCVDPDDPGNALLLKAIDPAPLTVGQIHREGPLGLEGIVALAVEKGVLTMQQLKELNDELQKMDDDQIDKISNKHWLSWVAR